MKKQILLGITTLALTFVLQAPAMAASDIPTIELSKYRTTETLLIDWAERLNNEFSLLTKSQSDKNFFTDDFNMTTSVLRDFDKLYPVNFKASNDKNDKIYSDSREQWPIWNKNELQNSFYDEAKREVSQHGRPFTAETVPDRYKEKVIHWAEEYSLYVNYTLEDQYKKRNIDFIENKNMLIINDPDAILYREYKERVMQCLSNFYDNKTVTSIFENIDSGKIFNEQLASLNNALNNKFAVAFDKYTEYLQSNKTLDKSSVVKSINNINNLLSEIASQYWTKTIPASKLYFDEYNNDISNIENYLKKKF